MNASQVSQVTRCACFNECKSDDDWDGKKFWVVLRVDGKANHPGQFQKHSSQVSAEIEAQRLTSVHRGIFMVMETVAGFKPPVEVEPVEFAE